ncbi:MAG: hypothetical protein HGB12_02315 [Bacteroidetes bacterium]|nr:hypothetical protein [Bacteroidota bacterium]
MKKLLLFLIAIPLIIDTCKAQSSQANDINLFGTNVNYQTGTILLTTINTALTTMNLAGINPKWQSKYTQGVAILTGASQLVYGIYQSRSDFSSLNLVNIGAGTATIITNSILLYNKLKPRKKTTTWNLYYLPSKNNNFEFGFQIVKHFKI